MKSKWVLVVPFAIFGLGAGLFYHAENEARSQFERARAFWREGQIEEAALRYDQVSKNFKDSEYAQRALLELGNLNYVNSNKISAAVSVYQRLVTAFPSSPFTPEAIAKLAEISEIEMDDQEQAILYWGMLLEREDLPSELRRRGLFRAGNAHFRLNQMDRARAYFDQVLAGGLMDSEGQQAAIRVGTILQLDGDYSNSVSYFQSVLGLPNCAECRLQARLGLIESFEFLGRLEDAIETAKGIETSSFPVASKTELIERLERKRRFYEPRSR